MHENIEDNEYNSVKDTTTLSKSKYVNNNCVKEKTNTTAKKTTTTTTATAVIPPLYWNKDICPSREKLNELVSNKHKQLSRAKMIVFDKDGTIGNCKPSLQRWSRHMTQKLQAALENNNKTPKASPSQIRSCLQRFHNSIGWDSTQNDVLPSSILAAGTWNEILSTTATVLAEEVGESLFLVETQEQKQQEEEDPFFDCVQMWHNELDDLHGSDEPMIPELKDMLQCCQKEFHYRVAVCTSDDRNSTNTALMRWDVLRNDIVQYSICGDEIEYGKPNAQPLQVLCEQTTGSGTTTPMISPQECIVVGDTSADTGMARNAGAAFCIGVLTGGCTPTFLAETGADIILPDVGHIPSLLQTMQNIIKKENNDGERTRKMKSWEG